MAKIIVDELVTLLSFETSKKTAASIAKVKNGVKSLKRLAVISAGALGGLAFAMDKIIGGVDKQAKFAAGIGVTFENLQQLQFAGQKAGASINEVNGFLENLTRTMSSTKPGEFNATLLQLGISVRKSNGDWKTALDIFTELGDRFGKLSALRRQQFGARLGAPASIVNTLAQGSSQILADMQEANKIGAVVPEILKGSAAAFFDDSLLKLKATIAGFTKVITLSLAPQLIKVVDSFEQWIIANKELIATGVGKFLSIVVMSLKNLKTIMLILSPLILAWVAAMVASAAPFLALGAAIAFVVSNLDKFKDVAEASARIIAIVFPSAFDKITAAVNNSIDAVKGFFGLFRGATDKLPFFTLFSIDKLTSELNKIGNMFEVAGNLKGGNASFPLLESRAAASTVTNEVIINVSGAASPKEVGIEVKRQFDLSTAAQTAAPGFNRPKVA